MLCFYIRILFNLKFFRSKFENSTDSIILVSYDTFHFFFLVSYSSLEYLTVAGCPITTVSGGTSLVTTEPIPITLFRPTRTPGLKTDLPPIIAPSSTVTPIIFGLIGYGSLVNAAHGPMNTFFPMTVSGGIYTEPSILVLSPILTL